MFVSAVPVSFVQVRYVQAELWGPVDINIVPTGLSTRLLNEWIHQVVSKAGIFSLPHVTCRTIYSLADSKLLASIYKYQRRGTNLRSKRSGRTYIMPS